MIAIAKCTHRNTSAQDRHNRFLSMVPQIRRTARFAFRASRPEAREELVAEVVANAYCAYVRLAERGKEDLAYPSPLAMFAICQVRSGRRVGNRSNLRDITSRYGTAKRNIRLEPLDRFNEQRNEWREVLVEDRKAGPAETAAARIDIANWLGSLGGKMRRIAQMLAHGESTSSVARTIGISAGRVSQLRLELKQSWDTFHGEPTVGRA